MGKFIYKLRAAFEAFTPSGTFRSEGGIRIRVSANGTSSIDPRDLEAYDSLIRKKHFPRDKKPADPVAIPKTGDSEKTTKPVKFNFKL